MTARPWQTGLRHLARPLDWFWHVLERLEAMATLPLYPVRKIMDYVLDQIGHQRTVDLRPAHFEP